jgi:histidinol-phosphate/aromatic aminotransferase/cobyric acid decarboxylase-like protein
VAGPTQYIANAALLDGAWQRQMRDELTTMAAANVEWLQSLAWAKGKTIHRHALFNSIELHPQQALAIEESLAGRGIRVRRIEIDAQSSLLRFGLIDSVDSERWSRRLDFAE